MLILATYQNQSVILKRKPVLKDYYSILGLSRKATPAEIKSSFRRLAKIYHPDKNQANPLAVEKFREAKEAYETLSNPAKKNKYDTTLAYYDAYNPNLKTNTVQGKRTARKNYTNYTEEEIKRRQYYQQHYGKYSNKKPRTNPEEDKKKYNETRAILLSIPIALALLFFIINIYNRSSGKENGTLHPLNREKTKIILGKNIEKPNLTSPYSSFFGKQTDSNRIGSGLNIINKSETELVFCLVNKLNKTVFNAYIAKNDTAKINHIATDKYQIKLYTGKNFTCKRKIDSLVLPVFCSSEAYYASKDQILSIPEKSNKQVNYIITKPDESNEIYRTVEADFFSPQSKAE